MQKTFFGILCLCRILQAQFSETDYSFWLNQFREHALFAGDFTDNPQLKQRSKTLQSRNQTLMSQVNSSNIKSEFLSLADEMKKFQNDVTSDLKKASGDQSLNLDLLDHMNKETDYTKRKIEKQLTLEEEVAFWSEEEEGQAKVMMTLMNTVTPEGKNLKDDSKKTMETLKTNTKEKNINSFKRANIKLDTMGKILDQKPSLTRVPKQLAKHEERERTYARTAIESARIKS